MAPLGAKDQPENPRFMCPKLATRGHFELKNDASSTHQSCAKGMRKSACKLPLLATKKGSTGTRLRAKNWPLKTISSSKLMRARRIKAAPNRCEDQPVNPQFMCQKIGHLRPSRAENWHELDGLPVAEPTIRPATTARDTHARKRTTSINEKSAKRTTNIKEKSAIIQRKDEYYWHARKWPA